jgi:hypothetical protein
VSERPDPPQDGRLPGDGRVDLPGDLRIDLEPELVREVIASKRFLAQDRVQVGIDEIATWDRHLVRESRLLVPVDVQALYVPPGHDEPMVRLPMQLTTPEGTTAAEGMPAPFDEGEPRPAGVHLHWAMPDALLRGTLDTAAKATTNRMGLPPLPDRWVVVRLRHPDGAARPEVSAWVLEADRAAVVPVREWVEGGRSTPTGVVLAATELTGVVGGSVLWSAAYDAVLNRFAFHDPLDGVGARDGELATYLVAGWWKDPANDPLDAARSSDSLDELLERLRWWPVRDWGDERSEQQYAATQEALRKALGLTTGERFSARPSTQVARRAAAARTTTFTPKDPLTQVTSVVSASRFAAEAAVRYTARPWHLRSSLLHGSVYGVPVAGPVDLDGRPREDDVTAALGQHDDDVLAALGALPGTTAAQRRDAERLLEAFTQQKLNRIDSPDGLAEIEETEHAASFASLPSGEVAATDRLAQRAASGPASGREVGRRATSRTRGGLGAAAPPSERLTGASATVSFTRVADLRALTESEAFRELYDKSDDILSAIEPRVVERPAARWTVATDPQVGLRGARRSLRHGGDGRGSATGRLTCRWPHHVYESVSGVVDGADLVPTLGNGSLPPEVLRLVREAVVHDPYHDDWLTMAAPAVRDGALAPQLVFHRLQAESALRFGLDGRYDGTSQVLAQALSSGSPRARGATSPRSTRAARAASGSVAVSRVVADELARYSILRGVDPDLVAVTSWSQPWVPLYLEWQVEVDGLDPEGLDDWALGTVDLAGGGAPAGASRTVTGRSVLTTGAAVALRSAVLDHLAAEDARDAAGGGELDEDTEQALRDLAAAVQHVDVVTAALSGLRDRLLGFDDAVDGLVRPAAAVGVGAPTAPTSAPSMLLAGRVRLTRARLVDAFGRLLEVPVTAVSVPERHTAEGEPGTLVVPPRLLRPARWQLRLVDAATPASAVGTEARVDQVDTSLQVSPVCGFLLPDHLDETLEVFGADGGPLGEILHEPVGGGVMWEIAPGREGPADSGPRYGLTAAQDALGLLAAGVVAADSAERGRRDAAGLPAAESALTALLRAVDTALWTVDTFASFGAEHVAGLVGRPIAVVRAQLELQLQPTTDVDLSDPARAAEWAVAQERLQRYAFPVRIGELTRTDDGVLGFYVDDDYSRLRVVDKVIAGSARESGRSRGQLGLIGDAAGVPGLSPIEHPYVVGTGVDGTGAGDDADTLLLHLGQRVTLTVLMHPAGRAHLTSGLLPRKHVQLSRDWVGPGLAAIAPSLRTGPLLVETDLDQDAQVRLPKVSVFGNEQDFWWRDTPATWRHDAILAATQSALLPATPAELREGWVRVAPDRARSGADGAADGGADRGAGA